MDLIPALSILVVMVLLFGGLAVKLTAEQLIAALSSQALAIIAGTALFGLVLVMHLFTPQDWTADVLKVLVGFLVGTGAAQAASAKGRSSIESQGNVVDASDAEFGDNAKVAGRDINETIEHIQSDLTNIKDAVFQQFPTIVRALDGIREAEPAQEDFLVNTLFERGPKSLADAFSQVVNRWSAEGWRLRHVTSDYQGMDGVLLIFARASRDSHSTVTAYHGSRIERAF
jgi:hypothetical protein